MPEAKRTTTPVDGAADVSLPHSLEAEESVVGGVLVHAAKLADVADVLQPQDFTHPALRVVYEAMLALRVDEIPVDLVTVEHQLNSAGTLERLTSSGGVEYLHELTAKVVTVENLSHHARIIRGKATARRLIWQAREMTGALLAGEDPYGIAEVFRERLEAATTGARAATAFPTTKIATVPELGPVRWLVENLWADEACGFVGGRPKAGKSWLSLYLGICVASGVPAFERHAVDRGRVLLFNAEDRPGGTKQRARAICRALKIDFERLDLHVIDVPRLWLDDAEQVEKLRATVAREKPKLVILDPLRRMHRGDEDKAGEMDPLLDQLRWLQREHHTGIMLVHHVKKFDGDADGQSLRGSSVFHAWLDSGLYVTHRSKERLWDDPRRVDVEHRDAGNVDPFEFQLQTAETVGGDALWLQHYDKAAADAVDSSARASEKLELEENLFIATLQASSESLTSTSVDKLAKKRNGWAAKIARRLLDAKTIEAVDVKGFVGYRLRSPA